MSFLITFCCIYLWATATIAPWFFMLARLKNMGYEADWLSVRRLYSELGLFTSFSVLTCGVLGILADVVFNLVNGTIIFRELPKEGLFTQRVKRWSEAADETDIHGHGHEQGLLWRRRLNRILPGHV